MILTVIFHKGKTIGFGPIKLLLFIINWSVNYVEKLVALLLLVIVDLFEMRNLMRLVSKMITNIDVKLNI